jgi:glycosyltransferase involved in cell wall biosynthesis
MKILQVVGAYYPPFDSGGVAFAAHNVSKALAKRGHEVTVYTTNALSRDRLFQPKQTSYFQNGVNVCYFNNEVYKPSVQIYFSRELMAAIKESICSYDLVHVHEYRSYIALAIYHFATKAGIPYILQAHGELPRIKPRQELKLVYDLFFGYRLLKGATRVIALNQTEAQQYSTMGVRREKIEIIPNGIELENFAELPSKGCFKKKFNIPEEKKIILYLGRIHKIKGIDFLVKAYARLTKNMKFDNTILVIAGPDDGYLSEIRSLMKSLKIDDKILLTGPLYGCFKLEAYIDADVYVLPSRYETFPMTILEAVACGTPVILTKNCGAAEYFRDKVGLVVEPDSNHLAEALFEILLDPDKQNMFKENCKSLAEKFSTTNVVSKLEKVCEDVKYSGST